MASIIKVNDIQDAGGNSIISSNGSGTFTSNLPNTGITEADMYRMHSNESIVASVVETLDDWERPDDASFTKIGDGVSVSSGVFTFPRTGIYRVGLTVSFNANGADSEYNQGTIQVTKNNGGLWDDVSFSTDDIKNATNSRGSITTEAIVDITDTSNDKVRVTIFSQSNVTVISTNGNFTNISFIRLGDT